MSIADKLTQLTTIRGDIRSALTAKGVSASDHDFADFATDIASISSFPSGLQRCEYIQNSTTCAIKTDIIPQTGDILIVDFQLTSVSGNYTYVGCANAESGSTNRFLIGNSPSSDGYHYQAADKNWINTTIVADTNRHTMEYDTSKGELRLDGEIVKTFTPNWGEVNYPLGVFGKYYGAWTSTASSYMQGKMFEVKLTRNGTDVLDLLPCYVNTIPNGDIGMFDIVSGIFYRNVRSGSFSKGADI